MVYRVLTYVGAVFFVGTSLLPIYWLLVIALTPMDTPLSPVVPAARLTPAAFVAIFEFIPIHRYIFNSVVIAGLTTLFVVAIGTLAGYAFGRLEFPGKRPVFGATLMIAFFPPVAYFVPLFDLFVGNVTILGLAPPQLFNTPFAPALPLTALNLPLAIFVLMVFFRQIPDDLEDAARVEGATRLGALVRVILPLSSPGVVTVAILTFVRAYNEYFFSFLMNDGDVENWAPIPRGLNEAASPFFTFGAAGGILALLPIVVLVLLASDRIVEGLSTAVRR